MKLYYFPFEWVMNDGRQTMDNEWQVVNSG